MKVETVRVKDVVSFRRPNDSAELGTKKNIPNDTIIRVKDEKDSIYVRVWGKRGSTFKVSPLNCTLTVASRTKQMYLPEFA